MAVLAHVREQVAAEAACPWHESDWRGGSVARMFEARCRRHNHVLCNGTGDAVDDAISTNTPAEPVNQQLPWNGRAAGRSRVVKRRLGWKAVERAAKYGVRAQ